MSSLWSHQFNALLWKNYLVKIRNLGSLVLEIIMTMLFVLFILWYRNDIKREARDPVAYPPLPLAALPSFIFDLRYAYELAYIPSGSEAAKHVMELVKHNFNAIITVRSFPTESQFEKYLKAANKSVRVLAAVVFDYDFKNNNDKLPLEVKYHLRFGKYNSKASSAAGLAASKSAQWYTDQLFPVIPSEGPRNPGEIDGGDPGYYREGFLALQHAVDRAIMEYHNNLQIALMFKDTIIFLRRMPYPAYTEDKFFEGMVHFLPVILVIAFSLTLFNLIRTIVLEKETKLKEFQLMLGLSKSMLWASCFCLYFTILLIIIALLCLFLFTKLTHATVLPHSEPSLVMVFLMCYAVSLLSFGFLLSTFFNKAAIAGTVGGFLYYAAFFPYDAFNALYVHLGFLEKLLFCLSTNVALATGMRHIVKMEMKVPLMYVIIPYSSFSVWLISLDMIPSSFTQVISKLLPSQTRNWKPELISFYVGYGATWRNVRSPVNPDDDLTLAHIMGMLLLDALLLGLIASYIDAVFPGQYGIPQPWNFFLKRSYWYGKTINIPEEEGKETSEINNEYFEEEPTDLVAAIRIQHLYKEFNIGNTSVVAIRNMSLNFYEGQITVLLGANGAGKTTTLSVLTGLYLPTRGKVFIRGYDVSKDMVQIRKDMGLCPQEEILFAELTVSEHLAFFSKIKGIPTKVQEAEAKSMLKSFDMEDKKDTFAKSLSGGMKRKLSVMLAFTGASKVVILDEPTSGMDPVSRRATWDLLQHYKHGRAILLTTHFMDEADVLGDRIAIMAKGTIQCCGSTLFLKRLYGVGYHLIMVKQDNCDVKEISALIYRHVPTAKIETNVAAELSFILPKEYTQRFNDLFTELEDRQKALGIASFGVSITTMEEVFFRVSDMANTNNSALRNQDTNATNGNVTIQLTPTSSSVRIDTPLNSGLDLHCQQFYAMFLKRLLFSLRNWKLLILQLLALLTYVLILMQGLRISSQSNESAREMDLEQYGKTTVPYAISGSTAQAHFLRINLIAAVEANNQVPIEVQGDMRTFLTENITCLHSCIIALSFEFIQNRKIITFWFNNEAYHSPSLSLSVLDNVLFRTLSGPNASIKVSNKPQPYVPTSKPMKHRKSGFAVAFNLFFGLSIFVSGFCLLTVQERVTKTKHLQFVSGVYVTNFWISALLWDILIYLVSCCLLLAVFLASGLELLLKNDSIVGTLVIFLLFGWSVIPFTYLLSFLFSSNISAYMKIVLIHCFVGFIGLLADLLVQITDSANPDDKLSPGRIFLYTLMVFPMHNFGMSISKYYDIQETKRMCSSMPFVSSFLNCSTEYTEHSVYSLERGTVGIHLLAMGVTGLVFFILIFLLETVSRNVTSFVYSTIFFGFYKIINKKKAAVELSGEAEDEDVQNERKRVLSVPPKSLNSTVVIKELIKIYFTCPAVLAVKNICLAIQRKECFGLLGLNGAGKSTTFQILTGQETATSGDVFIDNVNITKSMGQINAKIGYCPQFDALLNYMTAREIMIMYSRLWGIPENQIKGYVNYWVKSLNLEPHADKYIYSYSGGNKRRVSTAIALMGNPSVVLLDEPSTGMDPVARRLLWNVVSRTRDSGKVIIVTSHSMEECDALCTRLAIMVKGKFVCLGSPQHLKNKFGNIYILKVKTKSDAERKQTEAFKEFIERTFPGSELKSENQGILNYYIHSKQINWGKVFGILEEAKENYNLEDYSISQITLEQVYLTFANQGNEDK